MKKPAPPSSGSNGSRRVFLLCAAGAITLTAGIALGRMFAPANGAGDASSTTADRTSSNSSSSDSRPPRPHRPTARDATDRHDLRSLNAHLKRHGWGNETVDREMARLSPRELRQLITDLIARTSAVRPSGSGVPPDGFARYHVMRKAVEELCRRKGTSTLDWAVTLDTKAGKQTVMTIALDELAAVIPPEETKKWIDRMAAEFGPASTMINGGPVFKAMRRAVDRGADEVIRTRAILGESADKVDLTGTEGFPPDFDFAKLYAALGSSRPDMWTPLRSWATRDPQAAWYAAKADIAIMETRGEQRFMSIVRGAIATQGQEEGARWAIARLAELPAEKKLSCLRLLSYTGLLTAEGITATMDALPAEDRRVFARDIARGDLPPGHTFTAIATLPREDQLGVLEEKARLHAERSTQPGSGITPEQFAPILDSAATRFTLTAQERQRITAAAVPPLPKKR